MSNDLDFGSLKIRREKVTGPDQKKYILQEANGETGTRFTNARANSIVFVDGKMSGLRDPGNVEILLVALCLFPIDEEGNMAQQSLTPDMIRTWPDRVLKKLFLRAKEISEIDLDEDLESLEKERARIDAQIAAIKEDPAKNEPSDSQGGST
jgi:hypothetical protein